MYFIGADLGTSAVKLLLMDESGDIKKIVTKEYPLSFPKPGWAEQNPMDWWEATTEGIKTLLSDIDASKVSGIGVCGQMHSLVLLDEKDAVIRPAILWNDSRTSEQVEYLNHSIGTEKLASWTANIAFAGFTAPKLLWLKQHEPDHFSRINKIMLPKDYLNFMLTGAHTTDYSDASGTLLLDVQNKCWSREMLDLCQITQSQLPSLYESYCVIGTLRSEVAQNLGLSQQVKVVAGAGDNAGSAIGTGTIGRGKCNISLGTSGTIFISSDRFLTADKQGLHSFAHADGKYHLMGCMLSAASCNKWFMDEILGIRDYADFQSNISLDKLGKNTVFFLPYLMGERSPINDTNARGTFLGMTMDTTKEDLLLSVLEGVSFAIRDNFEAAKKSGITVTQSNICGGGAKSPLWKTILSNVLGIPLDIVKTEQGPGFGGAILAAVGCGAYASVEEACNELVSVVEQVRPEKSLVKLYEEKYQKFAEIYPSLKNVFRNL